MASGLLVVGFFAILTWATRPGRRATPVNAAPLDTAGGVCSTCGRPLTTGTIASDSPAQPTEEMIDIPKSIVEDLTHHLARLEVLERREQMRIVRRAEGRKRL